MNKTLDVKLNPDKVYEAIAEGVDRAIWRMITNETDTPCKDFYLLLRQLNMSILLCSISDIGMFEIALYMSGSLQESSHE
jgi:hypothetical protein